MPVLQPKLLQEGSMAKQKLTYTNDHILIGKVQINAKYLMDQ